jgi:Alr-MurF fusion protein
MINLNDILKAANGQLFGELAAQLFTDFCLDPAQARDGMLFVAMRSSQGDTHHYIEEAIKNGASGVICIGPPAVDTKGVSVLMVRDPVDALMAWARHVLGKLNVRPVVVTGSTGKSMAAAAITHVLRSKYKVHEGDLDDDGRLSLPLSLAQISHDHEYVVLKLETTEPGEMAQMVEIAQPEIGIITQIDCVHRAGFEDCDQYVKEYHALIDFLRSPDSMLVLNYDDSRTPELMARATQIKTQVRTIGIDQWGADMMGFNPKYGLQRTGFDLRYEERYLGRWAPVPGKLHLYSLLMALMVGVRAGIPIEDALKALTELQPLAGRLNPLEGKHGTMLIDDTYKASVASTLAALDWLNVVRSDGQRLIFVMGDMDQLGRNTQVAHRQVGVRAAEVADVIITQGAQAALVGRAALDHGKEPDKIHTTYSVQDTVAALDKLNLNENDIVLFKGGETARIEQVVRTLMVQPNDMGRLVRQKTTRSVVDLPNLPLFPSWIDIDRDALATNIRIIKSMLAQEVTLMAVVKANAYGHGAVMAARTALLNGAEYLGVASMGEALALRDAGIGAPILVMSYAPVNAVRQAILQRITVTVFDLDLAQQYDRAARDIEGILKYHVKIDTGMGRLGVLPEDAVTMFRHLQALKNIQLEGIFTHFATADSDTAYMKQQYDAFRTLIKVIRASGFPFKYAHIANSAALLRDAQYHMDMVRPGLALYGLKPGDDVELPHGIQPALSWKTTILQVKTLPKGHPVGYGNTYTTTGIERIAILPVGYSDGLRRAPQTWREVLIHGKRAPLVGRISMEKSAVNVTHIPEATAGDDVVLLGKQGEDTITAEEIAGWLGTSNYEVITTIAVQLQRT